jgi:hypothetical protein
VRSEVAPSSIEMRHSLGRFAILRVLSYLAMALGGAVAAFRERRASRRPGRAMAGYMMVSVTAAANTHGSTMCLKLPTRDLTLLFEGMQVTRTRAAESLILSLRSWIGIVRDLHASRPHSRWEKAGRRPGFQASWARGGTARRGHVCSHSKQSVSTRHMARRG